MKRCLVIICLSLLAALPGRAAEPAEAEVFAIAAKAFNDGFHERAERELGEFTAKFPASTNLPRAILMQVQARQALKQFDPALGLIDKHLPTAGELAPAYLFSRADILLEKGDYAGAAEGYRRVINEAPQSSFVVSAALNEAVSYYRAKDLAKSMELLSPPATFAQWAATNQTNQLAIRGMLLLSEARLASQKAPEAKAAVEPLLKLNLSPEQAWEAQELLARIEIISDQPANALKALSNAAAAALASKNSLRLAQAWNLEAEVHKKMGQPLLAAEAYDRIAATETLPPDQKRLALLKSVELFTSPNQLTNGITRLENYLARNPQEPSADLLRIKAGELWLQRAEAIVVRGVNTLPPEATNAHTQARFHFNFVIHQLTNSPHLGKAHLNLGWSYWNEGEALNDAGLIQASQAAFQTAVEKLVRSEDQAAARLKIGDVLAFQKQYAPALTNYTLVLRSYADLPQVKTRLFERAYQQAVRVSLEQQDFATAGGLVDEMRAAFPRSTTTEQTIFLQGQALARAAKFNEARAVFADFLTNFPQSALVPSVQLAEARTYSGEENWPQAITRFDAWLAANTNHTLRAQAAFQRAWLHDQAGNKTNALTLFTNFATQFPTHPLAPAAQNWAADFFYDLERWDLAELNYQRIFQNTNWSSTEVAFHARLMAARTAFFRQGYNDARGYLTNLLNDPSCPPELKPEALFTLGDVTVEQQIVGSTNVVQNYIDALAIFELITRQYPTNKITPLAWGKKGDCHFQLTVQYPNSISEATNAYHAVLNWAAGEVPVSALNQAEHGLALVLERMAESKPPGEREALLTRALDHHLNVVHGKNLGNRKPDPFYLKKSALAAGRLAESLGEREAAVRLYQRLVEEVPAMRPVWESRLQLLQRDQAARL